MVVIWVLTATTWAGHVALLLVPQPTLGLLLAGPVPPGLLLSLLAALVPQLVIVPWAWRDSGRRPLPSGQRIAWRIAIFCLGFLAVTAYAVRFRSPATRPSSPAES